MTPLEPAQGTQLRQPGISCISRPLQSNPNSIWCTHRLSHEIHNFFFPRMCFIISNPLENSNTTISIQLSYSTRTTVHYAINMTVWKAPLSMKQHVLTILLLTKLTLGWFLFWLFFWFFYFVWDLSKYVDIQVSFSLKQCWKSPLTCSLVSKLFWKLVLFNIISRRTLTAHELLI